MTIISMIVAHDDNNTIGLDNKLPWHIPEDMVHFKEKTMGKPVIMGRKTFDSIGKPLKGRRNIVITRNPDYIVDGIEVAFSLEEAIKLAGDVPEIMIIGGTQIYEQALPLTRKLYVTKVEGVYEGDTKFPDYSNSWISLRSRYTETSITGVKYQFRELILGNRDKSSIIARKAFAPEEILPEVKEHVTPSK